MIKEILLGGGIATLSGLTGFLISKKLSNAHLDVYTEQAKAKAGAIEKEAELLLERSNLKAKRSRSKRKSSTTKRASVQ